MRVAEPFLLNPNNRPLLEGRVSYKHLAKDDSEGQTGFLLLFIIVGLIASAVLLFWVTTEWIEWATLRSSGVETQGTVTGRRVDSTDDGTNYYVSYSYWHTPSNGDPLAYTREEQVSHESYQNAEQGRPIAVIYTPQTPTIASLDLNLSPPWFISLFTLIWIPGFLGIPMFMFGKFARQQGITRRLRKGSRKLIGELLECQHNHGEDDCFVKLRYRFQSPQGGMLEGSHELKRNDLAQAALPYAGTPVIVLYRDDQTFQVL
jgi:hypothetical protein